MKLNNPLVTSFRYNDKEYDIDLAFDNVLDAFDVLKDKALRDNEKAEIALMLLLDKEVGEDTVELWNYVYDTFIKFDDNKKPIEYDLKGNPMPADDADEGEQAIDIQQDAEYLYSSFIQAYNIDLYEEQGKLHWHKFKSLLNGLPSDTIMQRIIQIRVWKPSKSESSEYKESMRKLQSLYKLDNVED